jgi:hypothetical protein
VPHVEQELHTLPGHPILVCSCCSIISFLCSVLEIVVCPFAIALFVLPIKASDYPFGIFNVTSLNRFKLPLVVKCCGHVQNHLTI